MIHVDRSRIPEPAFLRSDHVRNEFERAREFFRRSRLAQADQSRAQERFDFDEEIWLRCRPELHLLFHGKCAFCETPFTGSGGNVGHLRPRTDAMSLRGRSNPDHYWWLAYEWRNLYPICDPCSRAKGQHFPVSGRRARLESPYEELVEERRLLLDPCADENPLAGLDFGEDGSVAAREGPLQRMAEVTIQIFALDRPELVQHRAGRAGLIDRLWQRFLKVRRGDRLGELAREIDAEIDDERPFAGAGRGVLLRRIRAASADETLGVDHVGALRQLELPDLLIDLATGQAKGHVSAPKRAGRPRADRSLGFSMSPEVDPPMIESESKLHPPTVVQTPRATIERIQIRNYRSLRDLDVRLPPSSAERSAWKVFLGENGSGKSSALKAVAIGLLGEEGLARLGDHVDSRDLLRRWLRDSGTLGRSPRGWVKLTMSTGDPIEYRFDKDGFEFLSGGEGVGVPVRAYGASRLLPRTGSDGDGAIDDLPIQETRNLYDPRFELIDGEAWMKAQKGDAFSPVGLALKDLLGLRSDEQIHRRGGHLYVDMQGTRVRLDELSDGYQSVIALAVDVISSIEATLSDLSHARGIVLIDELGAHLHPRWRMRIVKALRTAFRGMQFLCTTHEPLCLVGLEEHEICVLRRTSGRLGTRGAESGVEVIDEGLPSPASMRVDQILTSPMFGLHSAIDPEIDRKFQEYYALLAHPGVLNEGQEARREKLAAELEGVGVLGYTRRDQMIYEVLDEFLAEDGTLVDPAKREQLQDATKERLRQIWNRVDRITDLEQRR